MDKLVPCIPRWLLTGTVGAALALVASCGGGSADDAMDQEAALARQGRLVKQGQQIFRFDTFGDERQWTDVLRLHEVISAAVDPVTALSVGL